jgi:hypothetical protein
MGIVVTVRIPDVNMDKVREVERTHAAQIGQLKDALKRHGCTAHRRLYRENEILDIDEWQSEEGLRAFLEEMGPTIRVLAQARGAGRPFDTIRNIN